MVKCFGTAYENIGSRRIIFRGLLFYLQIGLWRLSIEALCYLKRLVLLLPVRSPFLEKIRLSGRWWGRV